MVSWNERERECGRRGAVGMIKGCRGEREREREREGLYGMMAGNGGAWKERIDGVAERS